ncbi:MAG TPA: hypothetical protein VKU00_06955, partial [Chthonomonadaceae bacterium]|nr:hypothetical protein [Chthonomonadaceae bacterium]
MTNQKSWIYRGMALAALFLLLTAPASRVAAATHGEHLRCEYLTNPLSIHESAPRLSWILTSSRRGERQTAYQVLVASSPDALAHQNGDLWDSGKVTSEESAHVEYKGRPLPSRMRCYWKVRLWDQDGKPGAWSATALWSMGLMRPEDWSARWIAVPPVVQSSTSQGAIVLRKALYEAIDGAGSRDVTERLAGMMQGGSLNVVVSNQAMGGDPAYQHVKQLHVEYEMGGKPQTVVARENETLLLPDGSRALPYLRKSFTLNKPIRHASLYATALGLYE